MQRIFTLLLLCSSFCAFSQSYINFHTGVSIAKSPDKVLAPEDNGFSGYLVGVDLRLLDDGLCFLATAEYGELNLASNNHYSFFKDHGLSFYKGKFGVGFDLFKVTESAKFRSKLQGNLTYVNKYDAKQIGNGSPLLIEEGYTTLNESIAGLSSGLGFTYKHFEVDFEYEYGFYNIYYQKKDSKMHFYNLTAGFKF